MTDHEKPHMDLNQTNKVNLTEVKSDEKATLPQKGPLSFLSGALTSITLCLLCYRISQAIVIYFSTHVPTYSSKFALSIASGFKTLIIGTSFLATFTFGFIGLGLSVVFIRSLFDAKKAESK
tara:strand:+ start:153 stop:518 length:366 start_codon:yes stop_codon:yes gene_type:complete